MYRKPGFNNDYLPILTSENVFKVKKTKSFMKNLVNTNNKIVQEPISRITTCSTGLANIIKRDFIKNSDKTIKQPEKSLKLKITEQQENCRKSLIPVRQKIKPFERPDSKIKNLYEHKIGAIGVKSKKSLTFDNLKTQARLTSTFDEMERRLENLQTIFMNKLETLKKRKPDGFKKDYRFIAMVVNDEAKLIVKENCAKSLPKHIPARSLEDLNVAIHKFFTGCLMSFTNKLRAYQLNNLPINCDDIIKDLKREEQDFCAILKDWFVDMCARVDQVKSVDKHTVTESVPKEFSERQNDSKDFENLRIEHSKLKKQIADNHKNYLAEIAKLNKHYEEVTALKNNEIKFQETKEDQLQEIELGN